MPTPQPPVAPPRWARAVLRAVLPDDPMRDAIVGDLHEELVHDAARLGPARARAWYRRRAAGVVAHAALDALRLRRWASTTPPAESPRAPAAPRASAGAPHAARRPHVAYARVRAGGADVGLGALALGVLLLGVVVNTALFTTVRQAPAPAAPAGSALSAALGVGAVALAIACAGVAAVVLCAGPRWLRRRLHRRRPPCEEGAP